MHSHAGTWERGKYCGSDAFVATIEATKVRYTQSDQTAPLVMHYSGSHGPPWEPVPWLPKKNRHALPRRSMGTRKERA